jgi:hypothetical protein
LDELWFWRCAWKTWLSLLKDELLLRVLVLAALMVLCASGVWVLL